MRVSFNRATSGRRYWQIDLEDEDIGRMSWKADLAALADHLDEVADGPPPADEVDVAI